MDKIKVHTLEELQKVVQPGQLMMWGHDDTSEHRIQTPAGIVTIKPGQQFTIRGAQILVVLKPDINQ